MARRGFMSEVTTGRSVFSGPAPAPAPRSSPGTIRTLQADTADGNKVMNGGSSANGLLVICAEIRAEMRSGIIHSWDVEDLVNYYGDVRNTWEPQPA